MVYASCAQGITKKFKAQQDVASIDVSLEKKLVTIQTKEQTDLADPLITETLKDSGYTVEKIER